jgi:L-ascorbate metabolism protein UlaG (beta-lactamase superfamily)
MKNPSAPGDGVDAGRLVDTPLRPGTSSAALRRLVDTSAATSPAQHDGRRTGTKPGTAGVSQWAAGTPNEPSSRKARGRSFDSLPLSHSSLSTAPPFRWLGHGSLFVPAAPVTSAAVASEAAPSDAGSADRNLHPAIAVDPWKWRYEELQANVVLVTCAHVDHCCADDLERAAADGALGVGPRAAEPVLRSVFGDRTRILAAGETVTVGDVRIFALPHGPGTDGAADGGFHPVGYGLTYRLESPLGSYLFLGASRARPEHVGSAPDVAFFGVGGLLVPGADKAVADAVAVNARTSVPVLWGDLHGRFPAARRFLDGCAELGVPAALSS